MDKEKIKILYIDDEPVNLTIFKAGFRFDYDVYTAESAKEGVAILNRENIHVIIADQRMPQITGVEFFASILDEFPEPMRILMTGYADIEAVIAAINAGQIYRYLKKPWDEEELKVAIENAYEIYCSRKELKDTNALLSKTNEELNRFVYSASHDLKAPIMSVIGLLKVAELEGEHKDVDKFFKMITASVMQLDVFIHNIINYYKNSRMVEVVNPIDFKKLFIETLDSYSHLENKASIDISLEVVQPLDFYTDEFRVRVILNNLLSNAIKYQRKAEPHKKIDLQCKADAEVCVISIKDNGIGIKTEYLENIYKMFYRATRESTGSGIGLYIVKEAVERISGTIDVISEENKGTTFIITIPNRVLIK